MKTRLIAFLAVLILTLTSGCAYVNVRTPLDTSLDNTELGTKVGKSYNYGLFWIAAWGDGSYAAAAKDGDIKVMKHSDQEVYQLFFGLYTKRTVMVYGD